MSEDGHNEPCRICGKPCSRIAGNPALWPILLPYYGGDGKLAAHHGGCVVRCIEERARTQALAVEVEEWKKGARERDDEYRALRASVQALVAAARAIVETADGPATEYSGADFKHDLDALRDALAAFPEPRR